MIMKLGVASDVGSTGPVRPQLDRAFHSLTVQPVLARVLVRSAFGLDTAVPLDRANRHRLPRRNRP
jgi:hypothetical protein